MTRRLREQARACAASLLACALAPALARDAGDPVPLSSVDVTPMKLHFDPRLVNAPRAVQYFPKGPGGSSPSCGLLPANPNATLIVALMQADDDSGWPRCNNMPEVASFAWHGDTVYVFRYYQQDTREDTYTYDAFVTATADAILSTDAIDGESAPAKKPIRWVAAWGKSRLLARDGAKAGFAASDRDAVVNEQAVLQVGRDAKAGTCRLVVDQAAVESGFVPLVTPCKSVLATVFVANGPGAVLLAMLDVAGQGAQGRVFVVDAKGVRESAELERTLRPAFATGRMRDVKVALKRALAGG